MALGSSAGRSSGNRKGDGARRRNTQRERAYIDPPMDLAELAEPPVQSRMKLTPRGHRALDWLAWSVWLVACVMMAIIVCAWWGII